MFFLVQNDKLKLLKKGSLQHLGENMLAFLLHIGASPHFPEGNSTAAVEDTSNNNAIYFDILVICSFKNFVGLLGYASHIPFLALLCMACIMYHFPYDWCGCSLLCFLHIISLGSNIW